MESAPTAPGASTTDDTRDKIGQELLLPPWFEERRPEIVAMLEPIRVPEANGPVKVSVSDGLSRRTDATFVAEK